MNKKRTLLFRLGGVLLLLIIGAIMMVIGRGHTVYVDNKPLEYEGQTYDAPYKIVVYVDDEQVAKIYNKKREDRGMTTCIGQRIEMTLEITQEKGGEEELQTIALKLPYGMDGIAINLPAYLAGLPEEAYLSEFVITPTEEEITGEEEVTDEFAIGAEMGDI